MRHRTVPLPLLALALAASCGDDGTTASALPCDFAGMTTPAVPAVAGTLPVGGFRVALDATNLWTVGHADEPGRSLFALAAPEALAALAGHLGIAETLGSFQVDEQVTGTCPAGRPASTRCDGANLVLSGPLGDGVPGCEGRTWEVRMCQPQPHHLAFEVRAGGGPVDAWRLRAARDPGEAVFGLGEQFPHDTLDLSGRSWPILAREQGIGRGEPAVSETMELLSPGSSGDETTTYHATPHVLTRHNRSFFLENMEVSVFDLETADLIEARTWAPVLKGRVLHGRSPMELVERFTEYAGRMREPPAFIDDGAVVALARDLPEGLQRLAALQAAGARISAVWNQTWCGTSTTLLGEQVLWNWSLAPSRQADWDAYVDALRAAGARPLCYVNPMFRDLPGDADPASRNLYREAVQAGHVVRAADGQPYLLQQGVFQVALLDLSSQAARDWMKSVLKDEMLGRARCDGWMADYAEALPFDAVMASGEPAAAWHNRYPEEWARLHREALEEAGRLPDALVFHRSGFTRTPAFSGLQWEGDQAVTWDRFDGLRSALHGLLNGGFSGIALNHSDAGGFTGVPVGDPPVERGRELLMRWVELNAFTTLLRTHEGNQPARNAQVYSDDTLAAHFARFSRVFKALGAYRRGLFREAASTGHPVVRHVALQFPGIDRAWQVHDEFLLGPDVLVAPVLEPCGGDDACVSRRAVWLPPGEWTHLWSGAAHAGNEGTGSEVAVDAPIGQPPVFLRAGSEAAATLPAALRAEGIDVP